MNITEFRELLIGCMMEHYPELNVRECDVIKNNGVMLCGICIKRKDENVTPTIYLEKMFEKYTDGISLVDLIEEVVRIDKENRFVGDFDPELYLDYESIKEKLFVKLINKRENSELIKLIPNRTFLDLSIVVYCDVSDICGVCASILVKNEHIEKWGVNSDEVIECAYCNTKRKKVYIKDISDFCAENGPKGMMYVMSVDTLSFGAVSMTFDDRIDEFIRNTYKGTYIIPSSIHEVLLVPDTGECEKNSINEIICQVNEECLEKEEILSEHAYYYSAEDGYRLV